MNYLICYKGSVHLFDGSHMDLKADDDISAAHQEDQAHH